jgi:hypothetical protein
VIYCELFKSEITVCHLFGEKRIIGIVKLLKHSMIKLADGNAYCTRVIEAENHATKA